jgi:hypothetical protein
MELISYDTISIKYYECVSVLPELWCTWNAPTIFVTFHHIFLRYLKTAWFSGGGGLLNIKCALWFSLQLFFFSETFLTTAWIQRYILILGIPTVSALVWLTTFRNSIRITVKAFKTQELNMCIGLHVKYQASKKLGFPRQIFVRKKKSSKYQISLKSNQWDPSCCMRADMTKLIVAFCNLANAPKSVVKQLRRFVMEM